MSLLPIIQTTITIPAILITDKNISGNVCRRFLYPIKEVQVDVFDSIDFPAYYELRPSFPNIFDVLYLEKYDVRKNKTPDGFCLHAKQKYDFMTLNKETKLYWRSIKTESYKKTPLEITNAWINKLLFKTADETLGISGFRKPQLGALHAISAYFSLKRNTEAATIVLPTGTGKTEVMIATLIYQQLRKVLIIVPSVALRAQTAKKFYTLGCLFDIGTLPPQTPLPTVTVLTKGIKSIEDANNILSSSNVIIANIDSLNASTEEAVKCLSDGIEALFIDEAHHVSAKTWSALKNKFNNKKVLQFTATPFRNDGKNLDGQIIYNYSVGEAQENDYFRHIEMIPVEEYIETNIDHTIANRAVDRLKKDILAGYSHILMARVSTIRRANDLLPIYNQISPELNPLIVHSGMGKGQVKQYIKDLQEGRSKIIICVDMLGEGFDLPTLKIAAIHDTHKSLAITLQFVGRFIRSSASDNIGNASVIVNIADQNVNKDLQNLYSQGAEWDDVIKRLSEVRIESEIKLQDIINKLKDKGNLHKQISLWNLRPAFSAMLFTSNETTWTPELFKEVLYENTPCWHSYSEEKKLLVALAIHESPVTWGNYKDISDTINKILMMHFDSERQVLFIYSNDYDYFKAEKLAKKVCGENCELFAGKKVFNIFNDINFPLIKNLGTSQIGAISFTQYFGPNVTEGLDKIEKAKSNLINLAGLGYEDGERVLIGCSQKKGKIWSVSGGKISEWLEWIKKSWDKIKKGGITDTTSENDIIKDFIWPERIIESHKSSVYSIAWGEHIQNALEEHVSIKFNSAEIPVYSVDINIADNADNSGYLISIKHDNIEAVYQFLINGELRDGFQYSHVSGPKIDIRKGTLPYLSLEDYFMKDPPVIQYVDGAHSYNCFLIKANDIVGEYSKNDINAITWDGVDIKTESMGHERKQNSIQWHIYQKIKRENSFDIIINDDGSGEIADLIGIKAFDNTIHLTFVHCKFSSEITPGARIKDIDVVCGQAQKAIRFKHLGMRHIYDHIKHRENLWIKNHNTSRFLEGTIKDLDSIRRKAYTSKIELHTIIAQPGLKKDIVSTEILKLLGCTALYIKKTAQSELEILSS